MRLGFWSRLFHSEWEITDLDSLARLKGQFPPENLTDSGARSRIQQLPAPSHPNPPISWLGAEAKTLSFAGLYYATNVTDTIIPDLDQLLELAAYDSVLKRPHLIMFRVGSDISFGPAVIESVTDIRYGWRMDVLTGNVRFARFQVTLRRWTELPEITSSMAPEPSTRYLYAKEGDTFEGLAWQEYENARLGVKIRQLHPEFSELAPGDRVAFLPPDNSFLQAAIAPKFEALQDADFVFDFFTTRAVLG